MSDVEIPENYRPSIYGPDVECFDVREGTVVEGHEIGAFQTTAGFEAFIETDIGETFYNGLKEQLEEAAMMDGYSDYKVTASDVHNQAFSFQAHLHYEQDSGNTGANWEETEKNLMSVEDFKEKYEPNAAEGVLGTLFKWKEGISDTYNDAVAGGQKYVRDLVSLGGDVAAGAGHVKKQLDNQGVEISLTKGLVRGSDEVLNPKQPNLDALGL